MTRVYERKFDWDEARRRYAGGESGIAIARDFEVSPSAVYLALSEDSRLRDRARNKAYMRGGTCEVWRFVQS